MSKITFVLIILFYDFIKSTHDSFKNECGPYQGLDSEVINPKKEECFGDNTPTNPEKCCFVEGEKDLLRRTSCVVIEDTSEKRIELIEELSEIATKLRVDCNSKKEFKSECGNSQNPESAKDCSDGGEGKCCFVRITSEQFSGKACRKFQSIDINTIGEAVVAAKTVGAELEVLCDFHFLNINYFVFSLFLLFII